MTRLDQSIYKRRYDLLQQSIILKDYLLNNDYIPFEKFYKMKMQQEDAFKRWKFFNYMIKELTKLKKP